MDDPTKDEFEEALNEYATSIAEDCDQQLDKPSEWSKRCREAVRAARVSAVAEKEAETWEAAARLCRDEIALDRLKFSSKQTTLRMAAAWFEGRATEARLAAQAGEGKPDGD